MPRNSSVAPPDPTPAQLRAQEKKPKLPLTSDEAEKKLSGGFLDGVTRTFRQTPEEIKDTLDRAEAARRDGRGFVAEAILAEDQPELKDFPRLSSDRVDFIRQVCALYVATQMARDYTISELNSSPAICGILVRLGYLDKTKFGFRATKQCHEWRRLVGVVSQAASKRKPKDAHLPRQGAATVAEVSLDEYGRIDEVHKKEQPAALPRTPRAPATAKIILLDGKNPHKTGTDYHGYFEALRGGGTADEYVARGGHKIALAKYVKSGVVRMEG
jgi:hypothetical protein